MRALLIIGTILLAAGGVFADAETAAGLDSCILYYQDGDYQKAVDSLKALLPLIADLREEAEAYKYLGFSFVMLDMINKAKEFFRIALEKFPQMMIDTLEVPPNITIVFKQTKLETQMEKGEILDRSVQEQTQKRTVIATILTATGAMGTGAGGYFFYRAHRSYRDYHGIDDVYAGYQNDMDSYWNQMTRQLIIGGSFSCIAAVNLSFGMYLFLKKPAAPPKASLFFDGNRICLAWRF